MVRTAVLVSGGGTNLQALIDAKERGEMPHVGLSLVVSGTPGAYALARAARAGIPSVTAARRGYPDQAAYDRALVEILRARDIECVVLAGFLTILGEGFISAYRGRILNIHPSLIPAFCGKGMYGLKVHEAALARGVKLAGATVHLADETPDGGEILAQKAVEVLDGDTPETLQRRVMEQAEWVLLPRTLEQLCERWSQ
ncbi:MAG: phosphoribosylglycinamide formyltransferase [Oscillospiraceae bacterium]|nr:phosphoribosylglycinamide formyltransferase [Oscillospiraceae bacterium]